MRKNNISYAKYGYLFSIPFVLAFLIFNLYPTIYTVIIGFTDLRGLGRTTFKFLEDPFENYKSILNNATFIRSLQTTFIIWIFNFIPQVLLALLLTAWFTNRRLKVKAQGLFKVLIYMPNIITAATIAILFNSLTGYPKGPLNDLLMKLGILDAPMNFHLQSGTARGVVSFIQFWMWYGHSMIILIAGVLGINPTLFEAAEVDGATPTQIFFKITLPRLKTILLYVLVTGLIGGIQMFDIPRLFLWGGPDNATLTSSVFIYNQAFAGSYLYNRASAASMIVFIIILVLSGILFYSMRDRAEIKLKKTERNRLKEEKRMGAVR
ncbi:carbohydrate ABC transporter permease [Sphaerochaeta halotolerans]|jgi:multiple sugar transport system permease protein|uniref:Sugar ABC transporter permease n=1 Tax=Sphaerochaeta halotolerans TaxID=2293840 RepID=A0A372MKN7_9SPIR|nr:sugar ABC transporter permease [Sphaerochaeta halotolerans]MBG0767159.1 sugar ABC transporter permease [Spirochaetaceae bacterium]MDK2859278.1 cellobiose transport system permease protein [Sphaerochaeta sp.]MXI85340.1 ABC transporter permease subunit [Sphaerochaeta halotolerans]RFU95886.1 sugar ABC transporter permease [Sphaerochaeta halotolerans]